jgi:ribose transport system permease protein
MSESLKGRTIRFILEHASILLFLIVALFFGLLSSKFLVPQNFVNILIQASSAAILATGMTYVLLTAGIDLSVGSIMFVSAAVAGKLLLADMSLGLVLPVLLLVGLAYGAVNAFFIAKLRILAFVVTLATLFVGRGLGLWITETRAMNLPETLLRLGTSTVLGIPFPILVAGTVMVVAHLVLMNTPFGRRVYAVGQSREGAQKAGIDVPLVIASVYLVSGICAVVGGIVSLAQLGAVSPTFGTQREFAAIAAAVLGGTSLFGGRGRVLPGTMLGAVLIQMIENGLVLINADPYIYPLVTGAIIFVAVFLDSVRHGQLRKLRRRRIRMA